MDDKIKAQFAHPGSGLPGSGLPDPGGQKSLETGLKRPSLTVAASRLGCQEHLLFDSCRFTLATPASPLTVIIVPSET